MPGCSLRSVAKHPGMQLPTIATGTGADRGSLIRGLWTMWGSTMLIRVAVAGRRTRMKATVWMARRSTGQVATTSRSLGTRIGSPPWRSGAPHLATAKAAAMATAMATAMRLTATDLGPPKTARDEKRDRRRRLKAVDGKLSTCKDQFVALTLIFNVCSGLAMAFAAPIGLSYDRWGGRAIGTTGAAICAVGLLLIWLGVVGPALGYDPITQWAFAIGVLVCDFGSMLNSFSFMSLIWHFPGRQALILSLINATYQVSSFFPLVVEYVMDSFAITLSTTIGAYIGGVCVATYICWMVVPSQEEYYAKAKETLGMPLPKPPKVLEVRKMSWRAWEVLCLHTRDHVCSGLAISVAFSMPTFYMSFAAAYGEALFGHKRDGDRLAEIYVSLNGLVGLVLAPVGGTLADIFGVKAIMYCLGFSMVVATATCGIASWAMQTIAATSLVLFTTLFMLFVSRYLLMYAPPNRFGTVQGIYLLLVIVASCPISALGLLATAMLPQGVDAYRIPMLAYGIAGTLSMTLYGIYYCFNPAPATPPLLPEDERELAGNFGCATLDEVLQVVQISSKQELLKALSSTEPETIQRLVASIDAQKLAEMMAGRDVEDIAKMLEDAPEADDEDDDGAGDDDDDGAGAAATSAAPEASPSAPLLGASAAAVAEGGALAKQAGSASNPTNAPVSMEDSSDEGHRIKGISDRVLAMLKAKDKQAVKEYLLMTSIDDLKVVTSYQEATLSTAEQKKLDKDFNACVSGAEFAKLLRQRPELRSLVQDAIKRDMQRRVASMRRKRGAADGSP
mmetsp:Transcript_122046/g.390283  ORF Transcript_122046/g.390283 Transcript_122046/m.390283 type:complete len:790 (+) Transcript_122046:184-2553(+)